MLWGQVDISALRSRASCWALCVSPASKHSIAGYNLQCTQAGHASVQAGQMPCKARPTGRSEPLANTPCVQSQKAVKTAGVATEVHDGFSVLLTMDARDTCRLYGHITAALQVMVGPFQHVLHPLHPTQTLSIAQECPSAVGGDSGSQALIRGVMKSCAPKSKHRASKLRACSHHHSASYTVSFLLQSGCHEGWPGQHGKLCNC